MSRPSNSPLRSLAAILISLTGISHIAALWYAELNGVTVLGALFGTVYLIIGIGLWGQSRFTLFLAVVVPATAAALAWRNTPPELMGLLQWGRISSDILVALCSAVVLWQVRGEPSR